MYIIGFVLAYFLFNRTNIGLNIRAVGSNEKVAASMGIDKKETIFIGALIGGIFIPFADAKTSRQFTFPHPYTLPSTASYIGI